MARDVAHKNPLVHKHIRGYAGRGPRCIRSVRQSEYMQAVLVMDHKWDMERRLRHYWPGLGGYAHDTDTRGNGGKMQRGKVDGWSRDSGGSYEFVQPNRPRINWGAKETVHVVDETELVTISRGWKQRINSKGGILQILVKKIRGQHENVAH
jgi:hypothetical protein